jgi:hypothetical protein
MGADLAMLFALGFALWAFATNRVLSRSAGRLLAKAAGLVGPFRQLPHANKGGADRSTFSAARGRPQHGQERTCNRATRLAPAPADAGRRGRAPCARPRPCMPWL